MRKVIGFAITFSSSFSLNLAEAAPNKQTCKAHISKQEQAKGIQTGLLEAIAVIESKLNPHAVNACGRAHHFKSAADAANFVKKKQQEGVKNISVGAMQLHVPSHRHNFKSIEAMMDPEQNIAYAAKLLKRLERKTGSTEEAVKLYHSPNPVASEAYKTRVFGAWAKIRKSNKADAPKVIDTTAKPTDKVACKKKKSRKVSFSPTALSRKK